MNPFYSKQKDHVRKKIFISYREKDTAGETGRLVDALYEHFSEDQIFMDIEKIEPGIDFREAISHSLQSCDVFLAIIGPNWLGIRENGKTSRIFDPNDWVRLEVATALQRNIRVIPVLVDDGIMPDAEQIPVDLHPLLNRQAYEISNKRWKYDTEQFISFLVNGIGIEPKNWNTAQKVKTSIYSKYAHLALWVFILISISGLGIFLFLKNRTTEPEVGENHLEQVDTGDSILVSQNINTDQTSHDEAPVGLGNITGTWIEQDEGARSTLVIKQNGDQLTVDVHALGQKISSGKGMIKGNDVNLEFDMFGNHVDLKAKLFSDETMKGTYTFALTGDDQPVVLKKE